MPRSKSKPKRIRRALLGTLCGALLMAPWFSACAPDFDPQSKVTGLRVLAVVADKPYANPGDSVTFTMTTNANGSGTNITLDDQPVEIAWLGGCIDPLGDYYYLCYSSLEDVLGQLEGLSTSGPIPPGLVGLVGIGDTFTLAPLPADIVSRRPPPESGPHYGIAYVFFVACAGKLGPVPAGADAGAAGTFPIGCFDSAGNRLGADSFVPGYTQVYVFGDGRKNANPPVKGLRIKKDSAGNGAYQDFSVTANVETCGLSEDDRRARGCGRDPYSECVAYDIDVDVDDTVAEIDPDGTAPDGSPLKEAVWVDYYADGGDLDSDVMLISDPMTGLTPDHSTRYIGPSTAGLVRFWAVVHDARGGATVVARYLDAEMSSTK